MLQALPKGEVQPVELLELYEDDVNEYEVDGENKGKLISVVRSYERENVYFCKFETGGEIEISSQTIKRL